MAVSRIFTFLVHPGKGTPKKPRVLGTPVALSGGLFDLLDGIYGKSDIECNVDITFRYASDGSQQNDCRDLLVSYLKNPDFPKGKKLAERLAVNTDGRSGLGLLFLISGKEGTERKIVLSRFPTDNAIYVDENPKALSVQFLERVFMKNKTSYKAVAYRHASLQGGFWSGRAIDKQLNPLSGQPSDYWISDFLFSDFTTTPAAGTRRLAIALRDATKKAPLAIKQELTAAGTLAAGLAGQRLSINDIVDRLALSKDAKATIDNELKSSQARQEVFRFDLDTYKSIVAYKSVELSNGALLTAEASKFDKVFQQNEVQGTKDEIQFSTKGRIVDEKLKVAK